MNNKRTLLLGTIGLLVVLVAIVVIYGLLLNTKDDDPATITEITPAQLREVTSLSASDDLTDMVYLDSKGLYYIASFDEGKIYVVGSSGRTLEGEIPFPAPNRLLLNLARNVIYVTGAGSVSEVDLDTFTTNRKIVYGKRPLEMALSNDARYLFVINEFGNDVSVIDTESFMVVNTIQVGQRPVSITLDTKGEFLYVANKDDATVSKISIANQSVVGLITNIGRPVLVQAFPDQDLILVLDQFNDQLLVVDQASDTVAKKIDVVDYPSAIEYDLEHDRMFVASFTQSSIGVVDLTAEVMTQVIKLGSAFEPISGLNNMFLLPSKQSLIVTNTNNGNVFFVPLD